MNEKIENALKSLHIKCYFCNRINEREECIIYNYSSAPKLYSDNSLKGESYAILLNVYVRKGVINMNNNVLKAMRSAGFKGGKVQNTYRVGGISNLFNTAITFNAYLESTVD